MIQQKESKIRNLIEITPTVFYDFRGESALTYSSEAYQFFDNNNNAIQFHEDNISLSKHNVLRGLHGDEKTWKLVQCLFGEVYFVVVDMRQDSPTYKMWESFTLNDKNRKQVLIPAGCVNGHLCLSGECVFTYKQSEIYRGSKSQITIKWDEPQLNIYWPVKNPILSQRDAEASYL